MWNLTSTAFRRLRLITGLVAIAVVVAMLALQKGRTSPHAMARALADAVGGAVNADALRLDIDDSSLLQGNAIGSEIYRLDEVGRGVMISRVVQSADHRLQLTLPPGTQATSGYRLFVQEPVRDLEGAIALLLGDSGTQEELAILQRELWPHIEGGFVAEVARELPRFVERRLESLSVEDQAEVDALLAELTAEIEPYGGEFGERMVDRGLEEWWTIVKIVSGMAGRGIADTAENVGSWLTDGVKNLFGGDSKSEKANRPTLSQEDKQKILAIFKEEAGKYWKAKGGEITGKMKKVAAKREGLVRSKVLEQWLPQALEEVLKPAWERHGAEILARSREVFADFARRRVLTDDNAPHLRTAYIIRSSTGITSRPLLILVPDQSLAKGRVQVLPMSQLNKAQP